MELWKTRRREILAGGIVLLVIAAVVYCFLPAREQPRAAEDIAVMRISEVLAAHPSYARLMELRAEEATLALAVRDVPEVFSLTPPAADDAPFQDSVWQKNAQTVIGARVELERERKRLTEVYRKQTEDDYERRKKQIDDEYQNAITNINLKIDNQRAMHGPRVSEDELAQERAGLEAQREALRQERGARQAELYRTWQEEIRARVAARIEPQQATWTAKAKATIDAQKAEADRQKAEAEERNAAAMERAAKAQDAHAAAAKRTARLAQVRRDAGALEEAIWRDVRSRAAKIALMQHFSLILTAPQADDAAHLAPARPFVQRRYMPPVTVDAARDVTADMVREMQSITAEQTTRE